MTLLTSLLATLAAKVKNIPAGNVTATTVQGAINELDTKKAAITYVDSSIASAIVGVFSFRGTHDASSNLFPTTGGSGAAGAVRKADVWKIAVAGTLGGVAVNANDTLYALVNSPGQTAGNWDVVESNLGYTPENAANKDASGGYAGLTGFKLNIKNALGTFVSYLQNSNTAARTYTLQDRNGILADDTDLALKAPLASPAFTGGRTDSWYDNGNSGASKTIDPTNGRYQKITLTADCTLTLAAVPAANREAEMILQLVQDGTGSRAITWSNITNPYTGATFAPGIVATANATTLVTLVGKNDGWNGFQANDIGSAANSAIPAGFKGETITASVAQTAPANLASGTISDITSINLDVGKWGVKFVNGFYANGGSVTGTRVSAFVSTATGNNTTGRDLAKNTFSSTAMPNSTTDIIGSIIEYELDVTIPATYYLKADCAFSAGTMKAYGTITAVRK